jgi:2-dehydropantoate 2-reductase
LDRPVAIIGLGALGSVFAGLLARAGIPAHAVCRWREHQEAVQRGGLVLWEGESQSRIEFPVSEQLPPGQEYHLIIILVKSFDTESVAQSLAGRINPQTPVLTLQNGLGNAEALAAHLNPEQILAGITTFGALRESPGEVRLTGRGECEIGAWKPKGEPFLPPVLELFQRAGVDCRLTANVSTALWKKLAVNAAINPLTAILRVPNGALLELKALEPILGMVAEEVWRVAAQQQIALPTPPELREEICRVCRLTAANRSSMLRDVEQGRRTEIDSINGAVARLGFEQGVLAPVNEALAGLIRSLGDVARRLPHEEGEAK